MLAPGRFMWGNDYPHDEGTGPVHAGSAARRCSTTCPRPSCATCSRGNAAKLYDFDLDALAPLAEQYGPTVEELATAARRAPDDANAALLRVKRQQDEMAAA